MGYQCISSAMNSSALLDYQTQFKQSSCKHLCIFRSWQTELIHIGTQAVPCFRKPKWWICQKTTWTMRIRLSQSNTGERGNFQGSEQLSCAQSWVTRWTKQAEPPGVTVFFPVKILTLNITQWLWHLPEQGDGHCKWPCRKPPCSSAQTLSHKTIIKTFVMLQQITETLLDLKVSFSISSWLSFLKTTGSNS